MPKKVIVGIVKSAKLAQARVVEAARSIRHRKYGKRIRGRTTCYVHDENNDSSLGDTVEIQESRPLSKTKRWTLLRVVAKRTVPETFVDEITSEKTKSMVPPDLNPKRQSQP